MQKRQASLISSVILSGTLMGVLGVGAQQPAPAPAETPSAPLKEDEPIAITPRSKPEAKVPVKTVGEGQFGNFRYPIINNRGEVAFLAFFSSPKSKRGFGQAVFIRTADDRWKVIPEGEKATNLAEPVYGMVLPGFNDNGDLTFIASYGAEGGKEAAPSDPHDPLAHPATMKRQGLFVKTASGLKSLIKLGEEVPNMPSSFSMISNASTNSKHTTAFVGTYVDPDGRGLFMLEEGKLHLIVRSGQRLSAGEDLTFSEHYYPSAINERNEVAFLARVSDKTGVFIARKSGLETVAMTGKPSPIKGAGYMGFGNRAPAINNRGEVVFPGFYDGPEPGRGLFMKSAGEVRVVARSGDPIPETPLSFTDFFAPALNSRGEVVFIGGFGGRGRGLFLKTAKGIEPIAMVDQPVPGGGKDEIFTNFTQPAINDRGEVVFYAGTKSPTTGGSVAIFMRNQKGVLSVLARRGDRMPK
ncbi:MAG TPA: choice-of-anchor tandem repeat NxxGxxAF-containing protein [Blastocatellia bacterium]|nr:choice-of-anchor tandem repeat NxxGxxAF-containing protein [Blastocatellia bacterium]